MAKVLAKIKGRDVEIHIPESWVGLDLKFNDPKVGFRPSCAYINGKKVMLPSFTQWDGMNRRCNPNSAMAKNRVGGYNSTISESFKDYNLYMDWAEKQVGFMDVCEHGHLFNLDKDIVGGYNHYSEETCCFIPRGLNVAFSHNLGFESKRKMISDFIDKYFEVVSDDVIESLCKVARDYSLNLAERDTLEEFEGKARLVELWYTFYNTKLEFDVGIYFIDGKYKAQKSLKIIGYYSNPYDANKARLEAILIFFDSIISEMGELACPTEREQARLEEAKEKILKMIDDLDNRRVKLKEWVLKQ